MILLIAGSQRIIDNFFRKIPSNKRSSYCPVFNLFDMRNVNREDIIGIMFLDDYWKNPMYDHFEIKRIEERLDVEER